MVPTGPWFRMWATVLDCQKIQTLPGDLFKAWVNFCAIAKRYDGVLPADSDIAFSLRIPIGKAARMREQLHSAGLVDTRPDGAYEMHDWQDWQHPKDRSTERTRQYREKHKRDGSGDGKCDGKPSHEPSQQNGGCDGSGDGECDDVTISPPYPPLEQSRTEKNRTEIPPIVPPSRGTTRKPNRKPSSLADWQIPHFEQFWGDYWRRDARGAAEKAYRKAVPDEFAAAAILGAVNQQRPAMLMRDAEFRPQAATWLNQGRWRDEESPPAVPQPLTPANGHAPPKTFGALKQERQDEIFERLMAREMERKREREVQQG